MTRFDKFFKETGVTMRKKRFLYNDHKKVYSYEELEEARDNGWLANNHEIIQFLFYGMLNMDMDIAQFKSEMIKNED